MHNLRVFNGLNAMWQSRHSALLSCSSLALALSLDLLLLIRWELRLHSHDIICLSETQISFDPMCLSLSFMALSLVDFIKHMLVASEQSPSLWFLHHPASPIAVSNSSPRKKRCLHGILKQTKLSFKTFATKSAFPCPAFDIQESFSRTLIQCHCITLYVFHCISL